MSGEGSDAATAATDTAAPSSTDIVQESIARFSDDMNSFLAQLRVVWPHCQALKKLRLEFDVSVTHAFTAEARAITQQKLISEWNTELAPFFERIRACDESVFVECKSEIVSSISMAEKFRTCNDETKQAIWAWLARLNETAQLWNLYSRVPQGMMDTVQKATVELGEKISSGEQSTDELLNLQNLTQIGMNVATQLKEEDIQELTTNLVTDPSIFQGLQGMFSMMGGGMMQGGGGGGGAGPPNPAP